MYLYDLFIHQTHFGCFNALFSECGSVYLQCSVMRLIIIIFIIVIFISSSSSIVVVIVDDFYVSSWKHNYLSPSDMQIDAFAFVSLHMFRSGGYLIALSRPLRTYLFCSPLPSNTVLTLPQVQTLPPLWLDGQGQSQIETLCRLHLYLHHRAHADSEVAQREQVHPEAARATSSMPLLSLTGHHHPPQEHQTLAGVSLHGQESKRLGHTHHQHI